MTWQGIRGHDQIVEQFRTALARGRLASTFFFVGPPGVGKRRFALKLAQSLLCERRPEEVLDPCGECPSCRQVLALSHPDVTIISRPPDKNLLPLELLIGSKESRMQEGLCHDISLKAWSGRRKTGIIEDADYLNKEGANCLLKTLEEPPPQSILILIGTSEQRQLPTIRSRCQIVRFSPLPEQDVAELLVEKGLCPSSEAAQSAARQGQGSVERAAQWCDESLAAFRAELLGILSTRDFDPLPAAKLIGQFAEDAGKESAAKRARLRLAISLAEELYRHALCTIAKGSQSHDELLRKATADLLQWFPGEDAAAACLEVCLDAYAHVEANANQAMLIDWWLDELLTSSRTGQRTATAV